MDIDPSATAASGVGRGLALKFRRYWNSYLWKVDLHIIPIFCVIYAFAVMDRNNIGNAKVAGMDKILGLHGEQFNWVSSSLFFTYIFCDIPANLMLKRTRPTLWFPFLTISWATICMCMAAAKNYASLIILRLFLGAFEAGLVPGFIYYISFWYTKRQQGPRLSIFFSAGTFAGIFAGPLAAGLTNIRGSLHEYQYIFLIEGAITALLGIVLYFVISDYPEKAKFLTREEREAAVEVLSTEQALASKRRINYSRIPYFLLDWKLWFYAIIFWIAATAGSTQAIFGPTLILSMGYTSTKAQIMSSLPSTCGFASQILSMFIPRLFRHLSLLIMAYATLACACYIVLATATANHVRLAFLCIGNFAISPIMPWVSLWMLNNTVGVTQRGVGSALTIMLGGIGGLIGSHLYRDKDKPYYRHGHTVIAILTAILFFLAASLGAYFIYENRRRDRLSKGDEEYDDDKIEVLADRIPSHRYVF